MESKPKIIIVGGVAGGASAAARARRMSESADIILIERGPDISFANCGLPYHIGGVIAERKRLLVQTPEAMRKRFALDVRVRTEVVRIDRQQKQVIVRNLADGRESVESYDYLILSPGAEPIRPPLPGADGPNVYTLRNLADMDAIIKTIDTNKPQRAVVVGGGYIGLEMAESLTERGIAVTVAELDKQVMAPADPEMASTLHQELKLHGVDLRLGSSVTSIQHNAQGITVQLSSGDKVDCGLVVLSIGVRPESKLAKEAGLTVGQRGGIVVNEFMQTSDPAIYAVGDAVEVDDFVGGFKTQIPLAGPANRQGRIAASHIFGQKLTYKKTQGTAVCKIFNQTIAMTGLNEKSLKRLGMPYEKVYVHPANHASYYPGAMQMTLKLLFDPTTGKVLGAQAVGAAGVDKRIDVIAVAIRAGMTVFDLEDLELCYAPPYGSAKDPVNYAGFVAANVLRGEARLCHAADAANPTDKQVLLDVRTPTEVQAGTIPGAISIPLDELRSRLGELPRDKEILAFCQVGLRGYLACRILSQHGFNCRNLSGGYKTYLSFYGSSTPPEKPKELKDDTGEKTLEPVRPASQTIALKVDACGLQCPGPILKLKETLDAVQPGQTIQITVTDPGFVKDVEGFCQSTGHTLVATTVKGKTYEARIQKKSATACGAVIPPGAVSKDKTMVVFSGDFDKAMAAFIIANGAAAMGSKVTMFFTFWGLNLLRKSAAVPVNKTLIEKMFGWMMPRGAEKAALSNMNMAGMGKAMIQMIMRKKNVASISSLIDSAKKAGVRIVACAMSMDLMGIKPEELIDGVESGGVAMYLAASDKAGTNLFI
jgi:NADPH-dependent 2,4-dienoyl-CoA reductase/sulfur reductase-like enzyme/peroxiredoxin family protein/TusA-related sulfurtransferase/rhodanese-related sulfurtransferase